MTRRHATGEMVSARLNGSEIEKLEHLSSHFELDRSATLRMCVAILWHQILAEKAFTLKESTR